ncbi:hypothetical protein [Neorhodopirellula lusitana]|uniref:hypothetical protein n=1 Tax=Neorhodopirellula lusitana TaxID=445327 RepID=UPI00384B17C1
MSIPPTTAIGAAMQAAKLTAKLAGKAVQESTQMMESFADVLSQSDEPSDVNSPAEASQDAPPESATASIGAILDDLINQLGLKTEKPMELEVDDHDQIQVLPAPGHEGSAADATERMQLQSHINSTPSLRDTLASLLQGAK